MTITLNLDMMKVSYREVKDCVKSFTDNTVETDWDSNPGILLTDTNSQPPDNYNSQTGREQNHCEQIDGSLRKDCVPDSCQHSSLPGFKSLRETGG